MNKKQWLRIRIEILVVAGILLILLTIMIPRFLGAQRIARAKHLQRYINAVMAELVKDDAAIVRRIAEGKIFSDLYGTCTHSSEGGFVINGKMPVRTVSRFCFIRKSAFNELLKDVSLPYLANDLRFGEPVFYLSLKYIEYENEKELAFFGMYAELYDRSRTYATPWNNQLQPGSPVSLDSENCYRPVRLGYPRNIYHPSNGMESDGIVYSDSYEAGWRVHAGTGPVIDYLKKYNP